MKKTIEKVVKAVYHKMQHNYFTFRILVWMKAHGITRKVGVWMGGYHDETKDEIEAESMKKSKAFYAENSERAEKMLAMLADDKSREIWRGVVQHRIDGTPLKPEWYCEGDQYFVKDIVKINDDEVFIDGGGYTGDTTQQFIDTVKSAGKGIKRIVIFEPNEENCRLIRKFFGKRKEVTIIQKGLSDEEKTITFTGEGSTFGACENGSDEGNVVSIPVINIDAVPECQDATWIKMDIEGSELEALRGAKQVIQHNRPKLTICIYHSDEDMIRIAEYVHEIVPEYKMYVRHHKNHWQETVLYAIP